MHNFILHNAIAYLIAKDNHMPIDSSWDLGHLNNDLNCGYLLYNYQRYRLSCKLLTLSLSIEMSIILY